MEEGASGGRRRPGATGGWAGLGVHRRQRGSRVSLWPGASSASISSSRGLCSAPAAAKRRPAHPPAAAAHPRSCCRRARGTRGCWARRRTPGPRRLSRSRAPRRSRWSMARLRPLPGLSRLASSSARRSRLIVSRLSPGGFGMIGWSPAGVLGAVLCARAGRGRQGFYGVRVRDLWPAGRWPASAPCLG